MRVQWLETSEELVLDGEVLGWGGEAVIQTVPAHPGLAAKIFHAPDEERAAKLEAMLAVPPPQPAGDVPRLAWPVGRLCSLEGDRPLVGYLMPRICDAVPLTVVANPAERREHCPDFHYGRLIQAACSLAAAVRLVHEQGYCLGDLNDGNVLVTQTGQVALVDVDSFQVAARGRLFRCRVGRAEYQPPEVQGGCPAETDHLPEQDLFSLAVLLFQLLLEGHHPHGGVFSCQGEDLSLGERIAAGYWAYGWRQGSPIQPAPHAPPWWVLPPQVQELFWRCFEEGHANPSVRPSAAEWEQALREATVSLCVCTATRLHRYPAGLDHCPWCRPRSDAGGSARIPDPVVCRAPSVPDSELVIAAIVPSEQEAPLPGLLAPLGWLGALVERQSWMTWLGVAAVGSVAGLIWALQHPPAPAPSAERALSATQAPQVVPHRPVQPAPPRERKTSREQDSLSALQLAWQRCQQAENAYQETLRAYQQTVSDHERGRRSRQEVERSLRQVQHSLLLLHQAQKAMREKVLEDPEGG